MLNSQFYCSKGRLVESVLMIIIVHVMTLEPWTVESLTVPYTLSDNDWEFNKKVHIKMHFYSWIWTYVENPEDKIL